MEALNDQHQVRLTGGPFDGKLADAIDAQPGITVVMNRIPDDGPMVRDLYLCTEIGDDGVPLANYVCTEAVPEPAVADDEPEDQVPALDPVIVATANTFRYLAEWFGTKQQRAELYKMAEAVEAMTPDCDFSCPVCEETTCDEGCPLAPVRNRWYLAALNAHAGGASGTT